MEKSAKWTLIIISCLVICGLIPRHGSFGSRPDIIPKPWEPFCFLQRSQWIQGSSSMWRTDLNCPQWSGVSNSQDWSKDPLWGAACVGRAQEHSGTQGLMPLLIWEVHSWISQQRSLITPATDSTHMGLRLFVGASRTNTALGYFSCFWPTRGRRRSELLLFCEGGCF